MQASDGTAPDEKKKLNLENIKEQIKQELQEAKKAPIDATEQFLISMTIYALIIILVLYLITLGYTCNNGDLKYTLAGVKALGEGCKQACGITNNMTTLQEKCYNNCTYIQKCEWNYKEYWRTKPYKEE